MANIQIIIHSTVVDIKARDVMFLLLHNKLPVKERLLRIRLKPDPYCLKQRFVMSFTSCVVVMQIVSMVMVKNASSEVGWNGAKCD